ncbi:unnamed protein product [Choristocarpus tenellus]
MRWWWVSILSTAAPGLSFTVPITHSRSWPLLPVGTLQINDQGVHRWHESLSTTQAKLWRPLPMQLNAQDQQVGDPDSQQRLLNVVCNDVVKTILRGQDDDVKALHGRLLGHRDEIVLDEMSGIFFENLLLVCKHELHPDVDKLKGRYSKAWTTILHYIEDAGWQLTDPPFRVMG